MAHTLFKLQTQVTIEYNESVIICDVTGDTMKLKWPIYRYVRFQVLTAASMKMAVFWVVAQCSLVEVYRLFTGACCLHHQYSFIALMMEAANTSETSANFYQTTRRNNPEDSHLLIKKESHHSVERQKIQGKCDV
jgi:hypothetical protein